MSMHMLICIFLCLKMSLWKLSQSRTRCWSSSFRNCIPQSSTASLQPTSLTSCSRKKFWASKKCETFSRRATADSSVVTCWRYSTRQKTLRLLWSCILPSRTSHICSGWLTALTSTLTSHWPAYWSRCTSVNQQVCRLVVAVKGNKVQNYVTKEDS